MTITKLLERLERIARKSHEEAVQGGWTICFRVCGACGFAVWSSSRDQGKGFKVEAQEMVQYEDSCERCMAAFLRSPEVFHWVMGVLNHQEELRDSQEKKETV